MWYTIKVDQCQPMIEEYFKIAYPICLSIPRQKRHVSLIFYKKQLISIGTNSFKTHPQAKKLGYRYDEMHSELEAYTRLPKQYRGEKLSLVNFRCNRFRQVRMSKPCSLCLPWCKELFENIIYTTNEGMVSLQY